jgi:hypothetical protein
LTLGARCSGSADVRNRTSRPSGSIPHDASGRNRR